MRPLNTDSWLDLRSEVSSNRELTSGWRPLHSFEPWPLDIVLPQCWPYCTYSSVCEVVKWSQCVWGGEEWSQCVWDGEECGPNVCEVLRNGPSVCEMVRTGWSVCEMVRNSPSVWVPLAMRPPGLLPHTGVFVKRFITSLHLVSPSPLSSLLLLPILVPVWLITWIYMIMHLYNFVLFAGLILNVRVWRKYCREEILQIGGGKIRHDCLFLFTNHTFA